jgi:cysteinyl-tRNA synthetase
MSLRRVMIYDTLSRETRLFQPLVPPKVGLFVCGLTPYDDAHIGHAKTAVMFDVVSRVLSRWGYRVFHVENVTNIDDKVIRRAGELGVDPLALSERHFVAWTIAMERLGVRSVNYYPHATDYMPEILAQIGQLIDRGHAYASAGSVYYSVASFPDYGKLSGQRTEALKPGARVEVDRNKRAPEDFALWKAATPGEPTWESPWGPGRPGWHIEDTAITVRLLGERYDLHGGGLDLKFPHHEAEIAQAEGATGQSPLVNFWMHAGLLNLNGEKMSKSLGNVVGLAETIDTYGPMVLRFYYVNTHYRSPLEFVRGKSLDEAREAYERLRAPYARFREALEAGGLEKPGIELPDDLTTAAGQSVEAMETAMADDFNTREAIARLFEWTTQVQNWVGRVDELSGTALGTLGMPYRWAEEVLGLFEDLQALSPEQRTAGVRVALDARARARTRGDFAESDRIRDELASAGIRLQDDGKTTRWSTGPAG